MAKIKKPNFDFKKFILERGEKVGFYAGAALLGLFLLLGIYVASTSASSSSIVNDMTAKIQTVEAKTRTGPADPPPLDPVVFEGAKTERIRFDQFVTPNSFFNIAADEQLKRLNPRILPLTEAQVQFIRGSIVVMDIIEDQGEGPMVGVLQTKAASRNSAALINRLVRGNRNRSQPPGGVPRPPAPPPPPAAGGGGGGGGKFGGGGFTTGAGGNQGTQNVRSGEAEVQYVKIDAKGLETAKLAESILPKRMVVITGSVPYRKQVELFAAALRASSLHDLPQNDWPHYRGYTVQRQTWSPDGKEMQSDWTDIDLKDTLAPLYGRAMDFEPEVYTGDAALAALFANVLPDPSSRLLVPRPKLRRGEYDPLQLPTITAALQKIKEAGGAGDKPRNRVQSKLEDTDIFNPTASGVQGQPGGPPSGAPLNDALGSPGAPREARPPGRGPAGPAAADVTEDAWLFRFIDVSVEPGHRYKYRIQLKVANPNYRRNVKELAIPLYADDEELVSPWFEVPGAIDVPRDEYVYAASRDERNRRVTEKLVQVDSPDATFLQVQRWADFVRPNGIDRVQPIGDWIVADLRCLRGQVVSELAKVRLPLWSMTAGTFLFRDPPQRNVGGMFSPRRFDPLWEMDITPMPQMMLVDFEGGSGTYNVGRRQIIDQASLDALLLTDDGKLIVRRSQIDLANPERQKREEQWKRWLDQVLQDTIQFKNQGLIGTPPGGAPGGGQPPGGGGPIG